MERRFSVFGQCLFGDCRKTDTVSVHPLPLPSFFAGLQSILSNKDTLPTPPVAHFFDWQILFSFM
jgi:hypothetical protein